jgi:hypothetical protein
MNTWTPEPGGPYDVPEHLYHGNTTALSSSGARTLVQSCPARFKWERDNGRPDTPDLEFGRAWHSLLLGGPPVVEIKAKTRGTKAEVDARAAGQIPLITKDYDTAHAMIAKLREHDEAGPLFARPGRTEQTYVARDPDTGVLRKIRIDFEPDVAGGRVLVVDGKTTRNAQPRAFARSIADYGYDQQGAFYCDVLSHLGLDNGQPPAFIIVAQEKKPPYLLSVHQLPEYVIDGGRELNRAALTLYAECSRTGVWPDYGPGPHLTDVPYWRAAEYEAAAQRRLARRDEELIGVPA